MNRILGIKRWGGIGRAWAAHALAGFLMMCSGAASAAGSFPPDVAAAIDHPLIQRFSGSALIGYRLSDWDQSIHPLGKPPSWDKLGQAQPVEGRITRLVYLAPAGKTPLEVARNYEQALNAAGFKKSFACDGACGDLLSAWTRTARIENGMQWTRGSIPSKSGSTYSASGALSNYETHMLVGSISRAGITFPVLLYTSFAHSPATELTVSYVEIVEPKPMPVGQVSVDAGALQGGLAAEGHVPMYGLFFDSGRAELKPESKPQLDEIAKLLKAQPALQVWLVGHTDNQGAIEANLVLSRQRAQAVLDALVQAYSIDAKRLQARGVANLAPVASNGGEAGRARNRRVELVLP